MTQLDLGFDRMLAEHRDAHLPSDIEQAVPVCRAMIERHHAAMLAAEYQDALEIRRDAHRLARRVNGGDAAIVADDDSPGNVLARRTAAPDGTVPLWGKKVRSRSR